MYVAAMFSKCGYETFQSFIQYGYETFENVELALQNQIAKNLTWC